VPADSRVEWGTSPTNYDHNKTDSALVTTHQLRVDGIGEGKLYYYRIISKNACGQTMIETGTYQE
jgi:hypothetical protein